MQKLNRKLDEFQDKPRNFSEPKLRYVPTADLRPEAIEALNPQAQWQLKQELQEGSYIDEDSYTYDIQAY